MWRMTLDIPLAILASLAMYLAPGYALARLLWRGRALSAPEMFGVALGAGIALPPLLLELARGLGLRWSAWAMAVYLGVALIINLALSIRRRPTLPGVMALAPLIILIALSVFGMTLQLLAVQDLPAGLWGDSLHHTMITQLLVDNGGIFSSWQPYAPLTTFTYHFGFHANAAFLHWLTGIPVLKTTLYSGQIILAASAPLAFLLASRVAHLARPISPDKAGFWAAVCVAFYNTLPAWLLNWGRYTQPTGQIVLVVALVCWMELFEAIASPRPSPGRRALVALSAVFTSCLILTHYLVTIWGVLCVLALALAHMLRRPSARVMALLVGAGALTAALAGGLALPWLVNISSGYLANNAQGFISGSVGAQRIAEYTALPPITPFFIKTPLMALAFLGGLVGLATRQWRVLLLAVWAGLLLLTATPQTFGLPGAGVIDSLTAYVGLYTFVAPLAGVALGAAQDWLENAPALARAKQAAPRLAAAGGLALALGSAISWQPRMADARYQLATPADMSAMAWIKTNTPPQAKFFVNTFPSYGGTLLAGSDAGWWLQFLTGRVTNLPPITYGSEKMASLEEKQAVNRLGANMRNKPLTDLSATRLDLSSAGALELLRANGFTHVYIGAHQNPPPSQADWVDPAPLRVSPAFRSVYAQNGVEIFELVVVKSDG